MNEDLYSTKAAASILNMTDKGFMYKAVSAGVIPEMHRNKMFYTIPQIEKVKAHKKKVRQPVRHEKFDEIVEYFKTYKENRISVIAKHFNIKNHQVSTVIDRYYASLRPKE